MQGPSPMPYWMSSIALTNGSLLTIRSARLMRSKVNPAPSAPGMALTARAATCVSMSVSPMVPAGRLLNAAMLPASGGLSAIPRSDNSAYPIAAALAGTVLFRHIILLAARKSTDAHASDFREWRFASLITERSSYPRMIGPVLRDPLHLTLCDRIARHSGKWDPPLTQGVNR